MLFNSVEFFMFFPIVVLLYWVIPKKVRYLWLLVASYYFYMGWNASYAILIAASTGITYLCGLGIEALGKKEEKKISGGTQAGGCGRICVKPWDLILL